MLLTIAIPTYNRNTILTNNLERLIPQLTEECELLIVDNASDTPVSDTLSSLLKSHPNINSTIVRNRANIGGNANILRCIELCQTDWIWILGDDDTILPDSIEIILSAIRDNQNSLFLNFASSQDVQELRKTTKKTTGIDEFIEGIDSFSNMLFITAGIYKASRLHPFLKFGYHYAYSMAPHFVLLLSALDEGDTCLISNKQIVQWEQAPQQEQWSIINQGLGIMTLLELRLRPTTRRMLANAILAALPDVKAYAYQIILSSLRDGDWETARYLFNQISCRLYYFQQTSTHRIKRLIYGIILTIPSVSIRCIDTWLILLSKEPLANKTPQSRFNRL